MGLPSTPPLTGFLRPAPGETEPPPPPPPALARPRPGPPGGETATVPVPVTRPPPDPLVVVCDAGGGGWGGPALPTAGPLVPFVGFRAEILTEGGGVGEGETARTGGFDPGTPPPFPGDGCRGVRKV